MTFKKAWLISELYETMKSHNDLRIAEHIKLFATVNVEKGKICHSEKVVDSQRMC